MPLKKGAEILIQGSSLALFRHLLGARHQAQERRDKRCQE